MLSSQNMRVTRSAILAFALSSAAAGGAALVACSSDEASSSSSSGGASSSSSGGASSSSSGGSSTSSGGSSSSSSSSGGADGGDGGCTGTGPATPVLDGGGACGTVTFGLPAAAFGPVDVDAGNSYDGGTLPPGVYDAVLAERASGVGGSWRETFVVDGTNRFTRIRQIQATADGGLGPITYRSGTYTLSGGSIQLAYDCARSDATDIDAGPDTLPYDVVPGKCGPRYRYGATGIRVSLERRNAP